MTVVASGGEEATTGAAGAAGMAGRSRIRGNEKKALAELCGTIIFDRLVVM